MSSATVAEQGAEVIPTRDKVEDQMEGKKTEKWPEITGNDGGDDGISWPQEPEMHATLQIPSFKKVDPLASNVNKVQQDGLPT